MVTKMDRLGRKTIHRYFYFTITKRIKNVLLAQIITLCFFSLISRNKLKNRKENQDNITDNIRRFDPLEP